MVMDDAPPHAFPQLSAGSISAGQIKPKLGQHHACHALVEGTLEQSKARHSPFDHGKGIVSCWRARVPHATGCIQVELHPHASKEFGVWSTEAVQLVPMLGRHCLAPKTVGLGLDTPDDYIPSALAD